MTTAPPSRARATATSLRDRAGGELGVGYLAVFVVTFLWGLGPLFVRAIDASALTIVAARNWISVPAMVLIAWLAKTPFAWRWMKRALLGGIAFTVAQTLAFLSFQQTSLVNAVLIGSMTPVVIAIAAVPMFGERLTRVQIGLVVLALGAVALFVLAAEDTSGASIGGDLLAFGGLIGQSAYFLCVKHARMDGVPAAPYITGVFLVAAVVVTPLALLWGTSFASFTGEEWIYLLTLGVIVGCVGHGSMTWAQKHVNVGIASVITLGTTIVTAIGGWLYFDQTLSALQLVLGAVVLVAIGGILTVQLRLHDDEVGLVDLGEAAFAE